MIDSLPVHIAPGASKDLTVQLNTANKLGKIDYNIDFTTNEISSLIRYRFRVTAVSHASVSATVDQLNFGSVTPGQVKTGEIIISLMTPTVDPAPVQIIAIPEHIDAHLSELPSQTGRPRQWRISYSTRLKAPLAEPYRGDLVVRTPSSVHPEFRFPVLMNPDLAISLTPTLVNFGFVSGRDANISRILLNSQKQGDLLKIISLTVNDDSPYLTVASETTDKQDQATLIFRIDPTKRPVGFFKTKVRLLYRCGDREETVIVPVDGYGYPK